MPAPCPSSAPRYYSVILHCIGVVSIPLNILGLYLVLCKSPGIGNYKYCVLYVQISTFFTEIIMTVLCPAYFFFPILGGFDTTLLFAAFLDQHLIFGIWLFLFCFELPALLSCFIYRHNACEDVRSQNASRTMKKIVFFTAQSFPFITFYCYHNSKITKEQAFTYLAKNYPQCLFWLDSPALNIYDWRSNGWIAVTGIGALVMVVLVTSYGFSLSIRTMLLLHQLRSHMSPQTYRIHRSALIALSLQVIIPSVLLLFPLFICYWVVVTDNIAYQAFASNSVILVSCHSVCSTMVMICANSRYRSIIVDFLKFGRGADENVSSVAPVTVAAI